MYNRYQGNTGRVLRIDDAQTAPLPGLAELPRSAGVQPFFSAPPASEDASWHGGEASRSYETGGAAASVRQAVPPGLQAETQRPQRPVAGPAPGSIRPPGPLAGLGGELGRLLGRLSSMKLETDDLLLLLVLYLMYRESHDEELLFIMAAMFLL